MTDEESASEKDTKYWAAKDREFDEVEKLERSVINVWRGTRSGIDSLPATTPAQHIYGGDGAVGLAISGGGIRSATFALGILQFLAKRQWLGGIDYLSTVSGGGYIGSSLTWFLYGDHGLLLGGARPNLGNGFPYGTASADRRMSPPAVENENLVYLRRRGRYLTPGKGITIVSGVGVALRGAALNILVWGPLAILAFLILFSYDKLRFRHLHPDVAGPWLEKMLKELCGFPWFDRVGWSATINDFARFLDALCRHWKDLSFARAELALYALIGAFLVASVAYSIFSSHLFDSKAYDRWRYLGRWLFETTVRWVIGIGAFLVVLLSIPFLAWQLGGALSGGMLVSGIVGGAITFVHTLLDGKGRLSADRYAPIVAALFLYGFGLVAYICAVVVYDGNPHIRQIFFQLLLIAVATGIFVNINFISLHRFYRDRLMEAFLPDKAKKRHGMATAADAAYLYKMVDLKKPAGPYHLINTHMITTNVDRLDEPIQNRLKLRGGDSFILAPLHCGSTATGWRATDQYCKTLSLATAMAISGAAANPNAGVGGMGVTRSTSVALVMALLNFRLGYWLPNPTQGAGCLSSPRFCNHFSPGLTAAFTEFLQTSDTKHRWVQLSDGGHFDNTGMYELLRRRAGLIILCDGSADPNYQFEDLHNALERAYKDFGIVVDFDEELDLNSIMPQKRAAQKYPRKMPCAERPFALGYIRYPARGNKPKGTGVLLMMTTVVTHHASLALLAHKDVVRDFPDESTMDQFFEEGQFEAYRELGWNVAWQTMTALDVSTTAKGFYIPKFDATAAKNRIDDKKKIGDFG